jgi:hypothetical protein
MLRLTLLLLDGEVDSDWKVHLGTGSSCYGVAAAGAIKCCHWYAVFCTSLDDGGRLPTSIQL